MSSPFKGLAEQSKITKTEISVGDRIVSPPKVIGTVKYTKEKMRAWITESQISKKSNICALLIGAGKIGKSGVVLDTRNDQEIAEGKKLIIFEMNSDNGCGVNKKDFHNSDPNIIILNPMEYVEGADGLFHPDYITTMYKIQSSIDMIKNGEFDGISKDLSNLKSVSIDGLDIFLSETCESQMRLDEHLDAAGGVSMRFWKNRNKFYYDVMNMILSIDVDKYFITHYTERSRDKDTNMYNDKRTVSKINEAFVYNCQKSTAEKMHQIIEFTDHTKVIEGKKKIKIVATLVADRRSLNSYMNTLTIAETESDGKVVWNGRCILDKEWK